MPGSSLIWRVANLKAMVAVTVLATAVAGAFGAEVFAQPAGGSAEPPPPDYEAAKRHYNDGQTASAEARWKDAAREYGIAYEITKDPILFFKLANAYDQDGDCSAALVYYQRYLKEAKPDEAFAKLTEDKIGACQAKTSNAASTQPSTSPATGPTGNGTSTVPKGTDTKVGTTEGTTDGTTDGPLSGATVDSEDPPLRTEDPLGDPADVGQPSWQRTAAWISVGVAVSFGVTGTVLGLAARSRQDDINSDIGFRDPNNLPARFQGTAAGRYDDLVTQGEKLELATFITFGLAAGAVATAVVFFVIDPGPDGESGLTLAPAVGPDSAGVAAGWRF